MKRTKWSLMPLLIPTDCRDRRYGGHIQYNYKKNLKKSGRRSTQMIRNSRMMLLKRSCDKGTLGNKRKVNNKHNRTYDNEIEVLSKEKKKFGLIISNSFLRFGSHLLKNCLMENFIFCALKRVLSQSTKIAYLNPKVHTYQIVICCMGPSVDNYENSKRRDQSAYNGHRYVIHF